MHSVIDDNYIKEVSANYFVEEQEMKEGIHPSQVIERVQKVLDESKVEGKITFMDYNNFSGSRVGVSIDGSFYGVFDYTENKFESTPESRSTEGLKPQETIENNAYLHTCACPVCKKYLHRGHEDRTFYCENCGTKLHQRAFTEKEINDALFQHEMDEYED